MKISPLKIVISGDKSPFPSSPSPISVQHSPISSPPLGPFPFSNIPLRSFPSVSFTRTNGRRGEEWAIEDQLSILSIILNHTHTHTHTHALVRPNPLVSLASLSARLAAPPLVGAAPPSGRPGARRAGAKLQVKGAAPRETRGADRHGQARASRRRRCPAGCSPPRERRGGRTGGGGGGE